MTINRHLALILVCALLVGCSSKDLYSIERKYYRVQKQAQAIITNPDATPPSELAASVDALNQFLADYPKTNVAVDSQFTIVYLYVATKEFNKAQAQLTKIQKVFKDSNIICAEAIFMSATAYEKEKNWPAALEQYRLLIQTYPSTPRGIEAPIYIAMRYKEKLQPDKMNAALREAIVHYKGLVGRFIGTPLALKSLMMAAQCYVELKEGESAIGVLQSAIDSFKGKVPVDGMMLDIAGIYYSELKDTPKSMETLNNIIAQFPKSRSADTARQFIERINKEKK